MAEQNNISTRVDNSPVGTIKRYCQNPEVEQRLKSMLGKRAGAFANSIVNLVKNDSYLQNCSPDSIMASAMIAASMNMPIDKSLGYAAIVPYGNAAQFQLMYKGIIQLCIRSGQYKRMHCTEIYNDELKSHNPITGVTEFFNLAEIKDPLRYKVNPDGVVGVIGPNLVTGSFFTFELLSGFQCSIFRFKAELIAHGKRFSKSYQKDLKNNERKCLWSLDPVSMWNKTVIKIGLGKYGIMSIELQRAFINDDEVDFEDAAVKAAEVNSVQTGSQVTDAHFEGEQPQQLPAAEEDWRTACPLPGEQGYVAPTTEGSK
jgi:recombination protein RecT